MIKRLYRENQKCYANTALQAYQYVAVLSISRVLDYLIPSHLISDSPERRFTTRAKINKRSDSLFREVRIEGFTLSFWKRLTNAVAEIRATVLFK